MYKKRITIIFTIYLLICFILIIKISYISIVLHRPYTRLSASQRLNIFMYTSNRGDILDRNLIPLTDIESEKIIVYSPEELDDNQGLAIIPYDNNIEIDTDFYVVEKKVRNSGIAEHLIGKVGNAKYAKLYGLKGLSGLEAQYDKFLKGKPGKIAMIVDGKGHKALGIAPYDVEGEKNENKLVLTIDGDIQQRLEKIIDNYQLISQGAVVVMDPLNGEVIAMISRPSINYLGIDDGSHLNKAIQIHKGFYPASTFKLVMALYGLENGVDLQTTYNCTKMCVRPHGEIEFKDSIAKSCNQAYFEIVQQFGPEAIINYAKYLGLGEKTGIGLNVESKGILPKIETVKGEQGNKLLAMGQGQLETTPLQIAKITAMIANGGYNITPKVVEYIGTDPYQLKGYSDLGEQVISTQTALNLQEMMKLTTIKGTAKDLKGFGAVKTGTADNKNRWLTGFFPANDPKYVVTIFIEEGYGKNTNYVTNKILEILF